MQAGRKAHTEVYLEQQVALGGEDIIMENLCDGIEEQEVIPIISNSVINNRIFDIDDDGKIGINPDGITRTKEQDFTMEEQLSQIWAKLIDYPLKEEPFRLCRVAQYNQVKGRRKTAQKRYLTFLKKFLLTLANKDEDRQVKQALASLTKNTSLENMSFSQVAFELGYPKFKDKRDNPLRLLAELPLPIYMTTSHHDFLERTLQDVGKTPHPKLCPWYVDDPEEVEDLDYEPSVEEPLVYHLYGSEEDPDSLVLSEDDFMDFLVKVTEDRRIIPMKLQAALANSSVLLIGYRLRDWDLRILLRAILKQNALHILKPGYINLAIQLNPRIQQWEGKQRKLAELVREAQRYLEDYFNTTCKFSIRWEDTLAFASELVTRFEKRSKSSPDLQDLQQVIDSL